MFCSVLSLYLIDLPFLSINEATVVLSFWFKVYGSSHNTGLQHGSVYVQDFLCPVPHSAHFLPSIHFSSSPIQHPLHVSLSSDLWRQSASNPLMQYSPGSQPLSPSLRHHHHLFLIGRRPRRNLGSHRVAGSDVDFENWVFCICIFTELKKKKYN